MNQPVKTFVAGGLLALAMAGPACATPPDARLEIHYSPEERLDRIDADLIATATTSIDLASYSLTDPTVIDALDAAQRRGVKIRIVLDPRERQDFARLGDLADTVRIKRGGPFMHLKAYELDGATLRTGSANFSSSGENAQDNDLIVIRGGGSADGFEAHFERMWRAAAPMIEFGPAINALDRTSLTRPPASFPAGDSAMTGAGPAAVLRIGDAAVSAGRGVTRRFASARRAVHDVA